MLASMSARQFSEWATFYAQDPWGDFRADLRNGIMVSTLANINRKKDAPAFTPQDFMPFSPKPPISDSDIEGKIDLFMTRYKK
jgi:hypothetical protein